MISAPYLIVVLLALQVVQCHKISLSRLEQRIEAVEEDVADLKSEVEMNVIKVLLGSGAEAEDGDCYKLCAGDTGSYRGALLHLKIANESYAQKQSTQNHRRKYLYA